LDLPRTSGDKEEAGTGEGRRRIPNGGERPSPLRAGGSQPEETEAGKERVREGRQWEIDLPVLVGEHLNDHRA
jgi:hypothetical protein